jgi:hypothetical protein
MSLSSGDRGVRRGFFPTCAVFKAQLGAFGCGLEDFPGSEVVRASERTKLVSSAIDPDGTDDPTLVILQQVGAVIDSGTRAEGLGVDVRSPYAGASRSIRRPDTRSSRCDSVEVDMVAPRFPPRTAARFPLSGELTSMAEDSPRSGTQAGSSQTQR